MTLFYWCSSLFIISIAGVVQNAKAGTAAGSKQPEGVEAILEQAACNSWTNLQQTLGKSDKIKFVCSVNLDCTGISCIVKTKNMKGTIEARVQHCNPGQPTSMIVVIQVPQLHVNWNHTFFQSEKISLSDGGLYGTSTDLQMDSGQTIQVDMQVLDETRVTFSVAALKGTTSDNLLPMQNITLPLCGTGHWSPPTVDGVKRKPSMPVIVDQDNESKVVLGTVTSDGKSCDLTVLGGCGAGETCEQVATETRGICKCLPHYHRTVQESCEADPTVPSSTDIPSAQPHQGGEDDDGSLYPVEVGVFIFVVTILLTLLVVSAYKYRWVPRIRARFQRTRPYEEMIIDGDENGMQSTNMSNPIV